jgi:hypothetical protein
MKIDNFPGYGTTVSMESRVFRSYQCIVKICANYLHTMAIYTLTIAR